ncbi:MerR family transcriptional regulator [Pseudonocardia sp. T1-2H]|uniref:MerR family transcriptional regulator n=1 Tax=Pseudonocardia sp. T1-2H TaxID=3128899 RepID=UPI0031016AB4
MPRYRVDELARLAGMTVRNVRAYQERGLLHPPHRDGRVALYDESHRGRLRIVGRLLERGYTVANIAELLGEWESGRDLASVLGLESAVSALWPPRLAQDVTIVELGRLFGEAFSLDELADQLVETGLLVRQGTALTTPSPQVLSAAADLVRAGVPRAEVFTLARRATTLIDGLAKDLLDAILVHVVDAGAPTASGLPDDEAVTRTAAALRGLAPAVTSGVAELLGSMIERHTIEAVGVRAGPLLTGQGDSLTARAPQAE